MGVAIVTGGSRGIGAGIARLLAANGYRVAVNYTSDRTRAEEVVADIEDRGGRALAICADVRDAAAVARMFATVDENLGPLSALVNNAAIHGPRGPIEELPFDVLQDVLAVNVLGLILCSQHAIRRMSTRHGGAGGSIVNISSGAAYMGVPGVGVHYAVSKGAVNSFTIGLSQEVAAEGIRVNSVSPGPTRAGMMDDDDLESAAANIPIGRVGEPREIAEAVRWLLSDEASYVAGANIRVAGGRP
ncbi:MAG: SDR family oxidoreductase [Actinomycetota bacterium]|nr:SDR family oxidoreductase [Actinomycetota bacterium]